MSLLDLVRLTPLMALTSGRSEIKIALIDGPVAMDHADLAAENIRVLPGQLNGACSLNNSAACMHGTFVAGILSAKRDSAAPSICPGCTLLVRPIFSEGQSTNGRMPFAAPEELAAAIIECTEAGARIINLSAALLRACAKGERQLVEALDQAARRGVIVVAAAGNQGTVGSTAITRHHWVIPVVACDGLGRPVSYSNMGNSIGRRGVSAPGEDIASLAADGSQQRFGGTSAAAPFVTGSIALLWSEFPKATAVELKLAIGRPLSRRMTVVPPVLDAWSAYQTIAATHARRRVG